MVFVEGIVLPAEWDDNGNVTGLVIAAEDEREYRIVDRGQIMALMPLVRREVAVRGTLHLADGCTVLSVVNVLRKGSG